jgi:hypothetical protein
MRRRDEERRRDDRFESWPERRAAATAPEVEVEEREEAEAEAEPEPEPEVEEEAEPTPAPAAEGEGAEGARLIALNMALNGTPREETARYLQENFELQNTDAILDEVYARVGG